MKVIKTNAGTVASSLGSVAAGGNDVKTNQVAAHGELNSDLVSETCGGSVVRCAWYFRVATLLLAVFSPELWSFPVTAQDQPTVTRQVDGDVEATLEVDREQAQVAQPIRMTLTVTAPAGSRVTFPDLGNRWGGFEVRSIEQAGDVPMGSGLRRRWSQVWMIETFRSGPQRIPSLEVRYRLPDSEVGDQSLHTEPLDVRVVSLLEDRVDPTDFRDIKPAIDLETSEPSPSRWYGWTGGGIGLTALLAVLFVALRRRQPSQSPGDWALTEITLLESESGVDVETADAIYGEMTDVLREYIQLRYALPSLTHSSSELWAEMESHPGVPHEAKSSLRDFLSLADEVKFARRSVDRYQLQAAAGQARQFVVACEDHEMTVTKGGK